MAIDQGSETINITTQERTWRVNIETAKDTDPIVTVHRETIMTGPDGAIVSRAAAPTTERALSLVANQTITVPDTKVVLTMAQVAATIAATADMWREEDMKASAVKPALP